MVRMSNTVTTAAGNAALGPRKVSATALARPVFFLVPMTTQLMRVGWSICNRLVMKLIACPSPKLVMAAMMATISKTSNCSKKTWLFTPMIM